MMTRIYILLLALCCTGCYTQQKAVDQSTKAYSRFPVAVAQLYTQWFNPVAYSRDNIIVKTGEPIYRQGLVHFITIDCDTVTGENRVVQKPCKAADTILYHDTIFIDRYRQTVDKAAQIQRDDAQKRLAVAETKLLQWRLVAIALAVYTLLRWLLRMIWNIKLP